MIGGIYPGQAYPGQDYPSSAVATVHADSSTSLALGTTGALSVEVDVDSSASVPLATAGVLSVQVTVSGSTSLGLGTTGAVSVHVDLDGATPIPLATAGTASVQVDVAASTPIPLATAGTVSVQVDLAGATPIPLGTTGALSVQVDVASSVAVPLGTTGALSVQVDLAGSTPIPLGTTGTLSVQVTVDGTTPIPLATSSHVEIDVDVSESDPIPLGTTGALSVQVDLDGTTPIPLGTTGAVSVHVDLDGATPIPLGTTGTLSVQVDLDGTTPIPLGTTGTLAAGEVDIDSTTALSVGTTGAVSVQVDLDESTLVSLGTTGALSVQVDLDSSTPLTLSTSSAVEVDVGISESGQIPLGTAGNLSVQIGVDSASPVLLGTAGGVSVQVTLDSATPIPLGTSGTISGGVEADYDSTTRLGLGTTGDISVTLAAAPTERGGGGWWPRYTPEPEPFKQLKKWIYRKWPALDPDHPITWLIDSRTSVPLGTRGTMFVVPIEKYDPPKIAMRYNQRIPKPRVPVIRYDQSKPKNRIMELIAARIIRPKPARLEAQSRLGLGTRGSFTVWDEPDNVYRPVHNTPNARLFEGVSWIPLSSSGAVTLGEILEPAQIAVQVKKVKLLPKKAPLQPATALQPNLLQMQKGIETIAARFGVQAASAWTLVVSDYQNNISDALLDSALAAIDLNNVNTIQDALLALEAALEPLRLQRGMERALRQPILGAMAAAGDAGAQALSAYGIDATFNRMHPNVVLWARQHAAEMVKDVPKQVRQIIAEVVARGAERGLTVAQQAKEIKQVIGLPPNWAQAPANMAVELQRGQIAAATSRRIPNVLKQQIERRSEAGTLDDIFIQSAQAQYAKALIQLRATTIARTETLQAANQGLTESWSQAMDEGLIPDTARRYWLVVHDDRLSPDHAEIPGMNADGRSMGEPFDTPNGAFMVPPIRPNCRCTIGLGFPPRRTR